MYHVFGYIEAFVASIFVGGAIIPRQVFNPVTMLEAIGRHRASELFAVPTMTVALVDQAARGSYDLSNLDSVVSAAAPSPAWLWERVMKEFHPRMLYTGYGQTEVSAGTAMTSAGDPIEVVAETVGRPKLGGVAAPDDMNGMLAEYRTVDPFTGQPLPAGEPGELSVRGPIVTRAYHNDPEHTARMIQDGWLRSGDLGWIDDQGYLHLTGRARELFKCGGENVAPKEIEDLLTRLPGVGQAYVAGVPDERMGEVGWAWVVPDGTADLDPRELIRYCRAHLAPFKVPRRIIFIEAADLPMTSTGKVQKHVLVASAL
jgi:fatty-acyl-CoA synthase